MDNDLKVHLSKLESLCSDSANLSLARESIDHALADHTVRLKVFMAAVSSKKIQSIVRMMNFLDAIEEQLLDPERWVNADNETLLKVFNSINTRIDNDMTMFSKILGDSEIDIQKILSAMSSEPLESSESNTNKLSKQSREKVRNALTKLVGTAGE